MRFLMTCFLMLLLITGHSVTGQITVSSTGNTNITRDALILKDPAHALTIERILHDTLPFSPIQRESLDFTNAAFWIKFNVQSNASTIQNFYIETARPITNKVILHEVMDGQVINTQYSGDDFPFSKKEIPHRKNIFSVQLNPQQTHHFVLYLESDGEMLTCPIVFWEPQAFINEDNVEQYFLGLYYGILLVVILIFFFFYLLLRKRSFLYYVCYVFFVALLQLSLDSLVFKYLLSSGGYLTHRSGLVSACIGVVFVLLYGRSYLKTDQRFPKFNITYNIFIGLMSIMAICGLFTGIVYEITYPLANVLALSSILLILVNIAYAKVKKMHVDRYFAMAFIILITGAIIFILRNLSLVEDNSFTDHSLKFGSALEVIFLSFSMANKYRELQQEKEMAQAETLEQLEEMNRLKDNINEQLEEEVKVRTQEIHAQKEELAAKNSDIMDSIRYAQRIQDAILPSDKLVKEHLPESFILYQPRDIVSGDFYWVAPVTTSTNPPVKFVLFAAVDCTGHGVPGAFMSIVGNNYLKLSLTESGVNSPAEALNFLNKGVSETLREQAQANSSVVRDGMDIALCAYEVEQKKLQFAGAKNPVYIITARNTITTNSGVLEPVQEMEGSNLKLFEIKGDKQAIEAYTGNAPVSFTNHTIELEEEDAIYVFSDGYPDQFGGPRGKKFMYRRFKQLLLSIAHHSMEQQKAMLEEHLQEWMGDEYEQVDDILIMGFKV